MKVSDFDYNLPERFIAQTPASKRDKSKLMVVNRHTGTIEHRIFSDVLEYLNEGDCLVLNNSKVIPARIFGKKRETGANAEFLLIKPIENDLWQVMVKPGRKLKKGNIIDFADNFTAEIIDYGEDGTRIVKFQYEGVFMERLDEIGSMPLPPYIERNSTEFDKDRYQTVYSLNEGSVAAPTAGLHFTRELLKKIREKGVEIAYVTLHVGIGTFRPVKVEDIRFHTMHKENLFITEDNARKINDAILRGNMVIGVGTTSTRTLESSSYYDEKEKKYLVRSGNAETDIFIYPGYDFKIVNSQITNFHLPKSTLLMLISAFYDRGKVMECYDVAKREGYRFFSYGDSMLLI